MTEVTVNAFNAVSARKRAQLLTNMVRVCIVNTTQKYSTRWLIDAKKGVPSGLIASVPYLYNSQLFNDHIEATLVAWRSG